MKKSYEYRFDDKTGLMYKKYSGKIKLEDIFKSWDIAIEQKLFEKPIKGFILDYREASFDIDIKDYTKIADYYKIHINLFGGFKIAVVTESVKDIVIPSLVEGKDDGYLSKPFYTIEAAERWVLTN